MIKHYLLTSIRNLRKNFLYSFINILGLTLAFVSILFVFAWVFDETSYDNFHPNVQNLYRVEALMDFESPTLWIQTPAPLAEALKRDFDDVLHSAMIKSLYKPVVKLNNQPINENGFCLVTPEFFKIFAVETNSSHPEKLISEPLTVIISESMAKKYFGNENPIGKVLNVNQKFDYTVKGIFKDYPKNSHLELNFIASFDNLNLSERQRTSWGSFNYNTYIKLMPTANVDLLKSKLKNYHSKFKQDSKVEFQLQKVKDIHLYADSGKGNVVYVYIFSIIGVLILVIAFINFINISTAKALERTKEIAVRKTFGATRKLLKVQIYTELAFLVLIAMILAVLISSSLIPVVSNVADKVFTFSDIFDLKLSITLVLLIIASVILSGFYPAIYLSSFDPGVIISNKSNKKKGGLLRKVLVAFQLTISVSLILGIVVIQKQMHYIQNKNLGFVKDNLMYIDLSYRAGDKYQLLGENLLKIGGIDQIAFSHELPVDMGQFTHIKQWDGHLNGDDEIMVNELFIDHSFIPVYGIKIKQGRNFRNDDNKFKIIVNQKAVDKMGLSDAVGARIYKGADQVYEIIGIADNFHYRPLSKEIDPLFMYYEPINHCITFKINSSDITGEIEKIKKVVAGIMPDYPFNYGFVDQEIDKLYRAEMRVGKLVGIFTSIALITSCLGIFGLSAFMAESRTKEIGVRKALGASTVNIILLMIKEIFLITLIANVIGSVVAYKVLVNWLANFQYKIQISAVLFLSVFVVSILIALITSGFHAIKSSMLNPAKVLKYE